MIGFLARFVGLWLIAGALVAGVIDATKSVAASTVALTPLGLAWYNLSPPTLVLAQEFVERRIEPYIGPWLWDPLIQWLLLLPTWAVLGGLGFLLAWLGRRKGPSAAYA